MCSLYVELWYLFFAQHLMLFYTCVKFFESIPKEFRVTDLNSRVDARVVANVDARRTDTRTNGRKIGPYIAPCQKDKKKCNSVNSGDKVKIFCFLQFPL